MFAQRNRRSNGEGQSGDIGGSTSTFRNGVLGHRFSLFFQCLPMSFGGARLMMREENGGVYGNYTGGQVWRRKFPISPQIRPTRPPAAASSIFRAQGLSYTLRASVPHSRGRWRGW